MRLSKIKLAGFKSFVDPTMVELRSNLVGIVGPNGCGKSNTIDAVRWVMGESSAKYLRGESMADVIFNGSATRKPVGQASIELIFDNSDAKLGGEYAGYNEISIKRLVVRDGQSKYYLNGSRCRRRDITDIFLGTGLGPRSYAIIEQGMISRFIEARPEDLRVYLEEAAGISKYKERRRETENRIRHTRENLERLDDVREEIEKQLGRLQRQADAAEKFKRYKAQERQLAAELILLQLQKLQAERKNHEQVLNQQQLDQARETSALRTLEAQLEEARFAQNERRDTFNTVQADYYERAAEIKRLEQAIQHQRALEQRHQRDVQQAEAAYSQMQERLQHDQAQLEAKLEDLLIYEPEFEQVALQLDEYNEQYAQAEQTLADWRERWETLNQALQAPSHQAQVEKTRMEQLEHHIGQLQQRLARLQQEQDGFFTDPQETQLKQIEVQLLENEAVLEQQEADVDDNRERIHLLRDNNAQIQQEMDVARRDIQRQQGRLASLNALQEAALETDSPEINAWLSTQGLAQAERLLQQMQVEKGWETAVEKALAHYLDALAVADLAALEESLTALLAKLEHGELSVYAQKSAQSKPQKQALESSTTEWTALRGKVISDHLPEGLLQGVYCAENLSEALALRHQLRPHECFMTREGVQVGCDYLSVLRQGDASDGVLGRQSDIESCTAQLLQQEEHLAQAQQQGDELRSDLQQLEQRQSELQTQYNHAHHEQAQLKAERSKIEATLQATQERQQRIKTDIEEVYTQMEHEQKAHLKATEIRNAAVTEMEALSLQREDLAPQREHLEASVQEQRHALHDCREQKQNLALKLEALRTSRDALQQQLEQGQAQLIELQRRMEELQQAVPKDYSLAQLQSDLTQALAHYQGLEADLTQAKADVQEHDYAIRQLEQERIQLEQTLEAARNAIEQQRMHWQEANIREQALQEQFSQHLESSELKAEQITTDLEAYETRPTISAHKEEKAKIGQRIQRLGAINLAAIDEFRQESERKAYLDQQQADLIAALETLEAAMRKIDRDTKTRFRDTFDRVNEQLQEMFPKLFGGGQAYLEMTENDLLNTGVAIMARPPGKRISRIQLMSGGEKALTAVAMVFAIFTLNPAPFCMLDEVDAPLDDANVGRFCELVRHMSNQVQFIFITHNKVTMELATHLMGVTMRESGVSRLVAVDVESATEMVNG